VGASEGHRPLQFEATEVSWAAATTPMEWNVEVALDALDAFADEAFVLVDVAFDVAADVLLPLLAIAVVVTVVVAFTAGDAATLRPETAIVPVVGRSFTLFTFVTMAFSKSLGSELTAFCIDFNSVEILRGLMVADTFTEPASIVTDTSPGDTPAMFSAMISARPSVNSPFCASVNLLKSTPAIVKLTVVGSCVGAGVGLRVGSSVGAVVGPAEGDLVGFSVGGAAVGGTGVGAGVGGGVAGTGGGGLSYGGIMP
jgi:hypothetical protein